MASATQATDMRERRPKPKPRYIAVVGISTPTKRYEPGDHCGDLPKKVREDYVARGKIRKEEG